jgi:hypothetical protein
MIAEVIEYGENFIVHRGAGSDALPAHVTSLNPCIRLTIMAFKSEGADERQVRNIRMPWSEVKNTINFLWDKGFVLLPHTEDASLDPGSWQVTDWQFIWSSQFGDPTAQTRMPESRARAAHQLQGRGTSATMRLRLRDAIPDRLYVGGSRTILSTACRAACCGSNTTTLIHTTSS